MDVRASEWRCDGAGQSLPDWEQIENDAEVDRVLKRLAAAPRAAVYDCPELYELAYPGYPGDQEFYASQAKNGHVVYLGAGTGRIFLPIARENPNALGVDNCPQMCRVLKGRCPHVAGRLFQCDAAEAPIAPGTIDTVVAPYSFVQVVGRANVGRLLRHVRSWLKPGGRFIADTFSPYSIPFRRRGIEKNARQVDRHTRVVIYVVYDHLAQTMQELALVERVGKPPCVLDMRLGYYFPREVVDRLESTGFDSVDVRGDFSGQVFDPAGHTVVVYEATRPHSTHGSPA